MAKQLRYVTSTETSDVDVVFSKGRDQSSPVVEIYTTDARGAIRSVLTLTEDEARQMRDRLSEVLEGPKAKLIAVEYEQEDSSLSALVIASAVEMMSSMGIKVTWSNLNFPRENEDGPITNVGRAIQIARFVKDEDFSSKMRSNDIVLLSGYSDSFFLDKVDSESYSNAFAVIRLSEAQKADETVFLRYNNHPSPSVPSKWKIVDCEKARESAAKFALVEAIMGSYHDEAPSLPRTEDI